MRVISGSLKGKKILEPKDIRTRPLKDLAKESIFNIIKHSSKFKIDLEKSNILDLFSGVGSFGIECLSRGTEKVTFVENYSGVLPILKKNLSNIKSHNSYVIIEKDIINGNLFVEFNEKFDLIFLDPPFKDKNLKYILTSIAKEKLLSTNGIIIVHRHKSEIDTIPGEFEIIEEKKYVLSKIIFLN